MWQFVENGLVYTWSSGTEWVVHLDGLSAEEKHRVLTRLEDMAWTPLNLYTFANYRYPELDGAMRATLRAATTIDWLAHSLADEWESALLAFALLS